MMLIISHPHPDYSHGKSINFAGLKIQVKTTKVYGNGHNYNTPNV